MRMIGMFALASLTASLFSTPGLAGSQTYCEIFAKDTADSRTTDVELWQISYRNAFNDCMNQYTAAAPGAAPKKALQKQAAAPLAAPETS
jgi:hypothetical protein